MGCWNGTCGISQMAITYGNKVKAVVIQNSYYFPDASGFCYSGGYATPISFVIEGQYNDNGAIENITDNVAMQLFRKWFFEQLNNKKITIQHDKYYDDEMNIKDHNYSNINNEDIFKLLERDRVDYIKNAYCSEVEDMKEIKVNVGFMLFHDSICTEVSKKVLSEVPYKSKLNIKEELEQDCLYAVEDLFLNLPSIRDSDDIYDELDELEDIPENAQRKKELLNEAKLSYSPFSRSNWKSDNIRKVGRWYNRVGIFEGNEGVSMIVFDDYQTMMKTFVTQENKEDIIKMLIDMITMIMSLDALRKPWMAQTGKGSQSFESDAYIGLANGILQIANKYNDEYEE